MAKVKFIEGTELFRKAMKPVKGIVQKGMSFAGGRKFLLLRGEVKKVPDKEIWNFIYSVKDGEKNA